jgi:hypothetical protein
MAKAAPIGSITTLFVNAIFSQMVPSLIVKQPIAPVPDAAYRSAVVDYYAATMIEL